jgi:hypothetical protein
LYLLPWGRWRSSRCPAVLGHLVGIGIIGAADADLLDHRRRHTIGALGD